MNMFLTIQELKENLPIDIKIEWSDKQYSSSKYLLYDIQDRFILVKAMEQDEQFLIPIDEIECITILEEEGKQ